MSSFRCTSLLFFITSIVVISSFEFKSDNNGKTQWVENWDYWGSDINKVDGPKDNCGDICAQDNGCWLKRFVSSGYVAPNLRDGDVCGFVVRPSITWKTGLKGRILWSLGCDFPGLDVDNQFASSTDDCMSLCANNSRNSHFYYHSICWMKQIEANWLKQWTIWAVREACVLWNHPKTCQVIVVQSHSPKISSKKLCNIITINPILVNNHVK